MPIKPSRSKKPQPEKKEKADMTILGHIAELRRRLFVIVIVAFVAFIACFAVIRPLADQMLVLGNEAGFSFVYLSPSELLTSYFSLSMIMALVITSPVILYEIWTYVAPALEKRTQRAGRWALIVSFLFFAGGAVFAYTISLPFMVEFLVNFNTSPYVTSSISVQNYLNFVIGMVVIFGFIFEMPILSYTLSVVGILRPAYMRKARQFAVPLIFVIAALITPPDVVSQMMIAIPMVILYEVSIWVSACVRRRKDEKEAAEEAGEEEKDETLAE